jgi:hypothetical protein
MITSGACDHVFSASSFSQPVFGPEIASPVNEPAGMKMIIIMRD